MSTQFNFEQKLAFNFVDQIIQCILKIVQAYENFKNSILDDINFLNDIDMRAQKILKIFRSQDIPKDFYSLSDSLTKQKQPIALAFSLIYDSFQKSSGLIEKKIDYLNSLIKESEDRIAFCKDTSKDVENQLNKAFQNYFESFKNCSNERECAALALNQILNKEESFDNTFHEHFIQLLQTIDDQEIYTKSLIESLLNSYKSLINEENDFIDEITAEIDQNFSILQNRIERKRRTKITVAKDIIAELAKLFYNLKCFSQLHSMPKNHIIPHRWTDNQNRFSARIWSDYQMRDDSEVSVKKKEMVDVIKVTTQSYWLIRKSNGSEGYVPCTILEPVG